jgi:DNA (cytosine-5)-methyltransferase 1
MGYHRAGFDVIGVDLNPQPRYPFPFQQCDALKLLECDLRGFDAIHASPPCQAYTSMRAMANARSDHPDLVASTRDLLKLSGLPWVMENVPGAPMDDVRPVDLFGQGGGITLCGSMFGLNNGTYELRRHRLFECSTPLVQLSCQHKLPVIGFYGDHARTRRRTKKLHNKDAGGDITGNAAKLQLVKELMDIDWMTWHESNQAIPPAYTEFIGQQLMKVLSPEAVGQGTPPS